jgi:hypothetical protein
MEAEPLRQVFPILATQPKRLFPVTPAKAGFQDWIPAKAGIISGFLPAQE